MPTWAEGIADSLWRAGWAVIPLAAVVALLCRWLPLRPSTRHVLWVGVLGWFAAAAVLLSLPAVQGLGLRSLVTALIANLAPHGGAADSLPGEFVVSTEPAFRSVPTRTATRSPIEPEPDAISTTSTNHAEPRWRPGFGLAAPAERHAARSAVDTPAPTRARSEDDSSVDIAARGPARDAVERPRQPTPGAVGGPKVRDVAQPELAIRPEPRRTGLLAPAAGSGGSVSPPRYSDAQRPTLHPSKLRRSDTSESPVSNPSPARSQTASQRETARSAEPRAPVARDPAPAAPVRTTPTSSAADHGPPADVAAGADAGPPTAVAPIAASARNDIAEQSAGWREWAAWLGGLTQVLATVPPAPAWLWPAGAVFLVFWGVVATVALSYRVGPCIAAPHSVRREVLRAAREIGLSRPPAVRMADARVSPMIVWGRGMRLILPRGLWQSLDREGRFAVLCHELAHLKRRDHWVRWAEILICVLYWWHPLVWWVRRRISEEAEHCCDAWVTWLRPHARRQYAEALLRTNEYLLKRQHAGAAVSLGVMSGSAKRMSRRITMVMTQSRRPGVSGPGLVLVGALMLGGWATAPLWACPKKAKAETCETTSTNETARTECVVVAPESGGATTPVVIETMGRPIRAALPLFFAGQEDGQTYRNYLSTRAGSPFATLASGGGENDDDEQDGDGNDRLERRLQRLERQIERLAEQMERLHSRGAATGQAREALAEANTRLQAEHKALLERAHVAEAHAHDAARAAHAEALAARAQAEAARSEALAEGRSGAVAKALAEAAEAQAAGEANRARAALERARAAEQRARTAVERRRPRSAGGGGASAGGQESGRFELPEGKLEALTALMSREDVPTRVRPADGAIEVLGSPEEISTFGDFVELLNEQPVEWRAYRLSEGKRAALWELMSRSDVPIYVSQTDDGIRVQATPSQHEAVEAFLLMIEPGMPAPRSEHGDEGDGAAVAPFAPRDVVVSIPPGVTAPQPPVPAIAPMPPATPAPSAPAAPPAPPARRGRAAQPAPPAAPAAPFPGVAPRPPVAPTPAPSPVSPIETSAAPTELDAPAAVSPLTATLLPALVDTLAVQPDSATLVQSLFSTVAAAHQPLFSRYDSIATEIDPYEQMSRQATEIAAQAQQAADDAVQFVELSTRLFAQVEALEQQIEFLAGRADEMIAAVAGKSEEIQRAVNDSAEQLRAQIAALDARRESVQAEAEGVAAQAEILASQADSLHEVAAALTEAVDALRAASAK